MPIVMNCSEGGLSCRAYARKMNHQIIHFLQIVEQPSQDLYDTHHNGDWEDTLRADLTVQVHRPKLGSSLSLIASAIANLTPTTNRIRDSPPCGLPNSGNDCYIIAGLVLLGSVVTGVPDDVLKSCFMSEYHEEIVPLLDHTSGRATMMQKGQELRMKSLLTLLKANRGQHQDPSEFLLKLLSPGGRLNVTANITTMCPVCNVSGTREQASDTFMELELPAEVSAPWPAKFLPITLARHLEDLQLRDDIVDGVCSSLNCTGTAIHRTTSYSASDYLFINLRCQVDDSSNKIDSRERLRFNLFIHIHKVCTIYEYDSYYFSKSSCSIISNLIL
jgi:hypothetical protein